MSGVGSFERENKTLYISKISAYGRQLQHVIRKHFQKFGELDTVRCVPSKNIAFVTYKHRLNAEFAKEAMDAQKLDKNETLIVRWGAENANENVKKGMIERAQEQFVQKLLEGPSTVQTAAFLHDSIPDDDLNLYYKQHEGEYSEYLYKNRMPDRDQQQEHITASHQVVDNVPAVVVPRAGVEKVAVSANITVKRRHENSENDSRPETKKRSALSALGGYNSDSD